ncbi:endo-1,4-beta-xylanase [Sorangium sp. So ce726]|uniref:endo-1,4-beta-xylanase n=1 Tax=Sorangium sp. So ce726 TaxID=3133319 RepID=UPI003F61D685
MRKNLISIGLLSCLLWSCTSSTSAPDDDATTGDTTTTSSSASTAQTGGTSASAGGGAGGSNAGGSGSTSAGGGETNEGGGGGTDSATSAGTGGAGTGGADTGTGGTPDEGPPKNLAEKYASLFPIGAAVDSQSYMTHGALLKTHFNSVTAENEMKFESLQRNENSFSYDAADRIVNFAVTNKMKVRGHALVWHSQNPAWLFSNGSGGTVSKQTLLTRMKNHISNVVRHFRGKVYAWDVVNEAMMEDGSYRTGNLADGQKSRWYEILGESYIAEAFKAAHEADPDAKLFYNDFYNYIPAKQQGIYKMLKGLLDQGVPVHGVGLQAHLNIEPSTVTTNQAYYQNVANMEEAIKLYSSLGLDVQVTELDISLYIPGVTYNQSTFYTAATFTDALKAKQAARYREFFELFRKYKSVITGVTFWGIADDNTWLSEFSSGRKDFPLLFDGNHNPKPAYDAVVGF